MYEVHISAAGIGSLYKLIHYKIANLQIPRLATSELEVIQYLYLNQKIRGVELNAGEYLN